MDPIVTIETLLLARFAETNPDATLTMVGGGLATLTRTDPNQPLQIAVAATLMAAAPAGNQAYGIDVKLRDPDGNEVMQMHIDAVVTSGDSEPKRIPVAFNLTGPFPVPGDWHVELACAGDLRVARLTITEN